MSLQESMENPFHNHEQPEQEQIMKLKLKHLAPYLPYKLKYKWSDGQIKDRFIIDTDKPNKDLYRVKPILRPLSDLNKQLIINNEYITPIEELRKILPPLKWIGETKQIDLRMYKDIDGLYFDTEDYSQEFEVLIFFKIQNKLFELHFDVFGLIEQGLAIDINTLPTE